MNLETLVTAYPQFAITVMPGRRRPRWQVVRRNAADPGLYAVITTDLDEAWAVMTAGTPPAVPACPEGDRP